ncbi:MAG: hypothetical protein LBV16_08670 [Elusimicrobiota bacterium]|jgi:hypothetical protein|nr:hypothetical protein [Elusimicrobiota bacterium]
MRNNKKIHIETSCYYHYGLDPQSPTTDEIAGLARNDGKWNKGQIFVEFLLVFIVLFGISAGLYSLYKKVWKSRFEASAGKSVISMQVYFPGGYVK